MSSGEENSIKYVQHPLGFNFCSIPFLWHYDDFAQPFPVEKIKKVKYSEFMNLLKKNNTDNSMFKNNLGGVTDDNTDFYILAQYRKEDFYYSENVDKRELYLSYHTWLYTNHLGSYDIDPSINRINYSFLTGVFSGNQKLLESENKKKNFGGIEIDGDKLSSRRANIHNYKGVVRFSGTGVCNFKTNSDTNDVFVSLMRFPSVALNKNNKAKIITPDGKFNCAVLHIFRNVCDNNPKDESYQKLINDFFY